MTKHEREFLKTLTTELGLSLTIDNNQVIIENNQLAENFNLPISHEDDLDLIKDVKKPLIDLIDNLLEEGRFETSEYLKIKDIQEKLS